VGMTSPPVAVPPACSATPSSARSHCHRSQVASCAGVQVAAPQFGFGVARLWRPKAAAR
jgi:hypothetical protein